MPEYLFGEAQALQDPFCPLTYQEELEGYVAATRIPLPLNLGNVFILPESDTPDPADNAKIWVVTDSNNKIVAIRSFSSLTGTWVEQEDFPYYFQDIGVADAVAITTGESIALNLDIQGRFFFVRIAAANTTTTPTFSVDTAPAVVIKKYGSTALAVGDLQLGMIGIFVWDGTQFQLLNPRVAPPVPQVVVATSASLALPATGSVVTYAHGLAVAPVIYSADFVCITTNNGYTATGDPATSDRIPFDSVCTGGANNEQQAYCLSANTVSLNLVQENGGFPNRAFLSKTGGAVVNFVQAQWNVIFTATKLTNA